MKNLIMNDPVYVLDTDVNASFVRRSVNALMLFFPITTFVLVPAIPGTTIITVLAGLLFAVIPLLPPVTGKRLFFQELGYFFA